MKLKKIKDKKIDKKIKWSIKKIYEPVNKNLDAWACALIPVFSFTSSKE